VAAVGLLAFLSGWWLRGPQAISPALNDELPPRPDSPGAPAREISPPPIDDPAAPPQDVERLAPAPSLKSMPEAPAASGSAPPPGAQSKPQAADSPLGEAAKPADILSMEALPVTSDADRAFVDDLRRAGLKPVIRGAQPAGLSGQFLLLESSQPATIVAPGQVTKVAHSTNTSMPGQPAAIGVLLRHGDSHYYSIIKGFSGQPAWLNRYSPGQKIGVRERGQPVLHQLAYCEEPIRRWGELNTLKLRTIAPQVWLESPSR
jgi:hypothetical protein